MTIIGMREEGTERSRNDRLRRTTSGFRYWLGVPFITPMLYWSVIWSFSVGAIDWIQFRMAMRRYLRIP